MKRKHHPRKRIAAYTRIRIKRLVLTLCGMFLWSATLQGQVQYAEVSARPLPGIVGAGTTSTEVLSVPVPHPVPEVDIWEVLATGGIGEAIETPTLAHLVGFRVRIEGQKAQLHWKTTAEFENAGFVIEQSLNGAPFTPVAYFPGAGTLEVPIHYGYELRHLAPGAYRYRLKQIEWHHRFGYSKVVSSTVGAQGGNAKW